MALSFVDHPASRYSGATVNQPRTGSLPALRGRAARISRAPTLFVRNLAWIGTDRRCSRRAGAGNPATEDDRSRSILTRMPRLTPIGAASAICLLCLVRPAAGQTSSFYTTRLDDPKAVYLTSDAFSARGDGAGDDTAAVQAAIDKAQETTGEGMVFVPSGRYRLTNTVYVWGGIRLIGYGATRPVFVLGANTPGYGDANKEKYMVFFSGNRPGTGRGAAAATRAAAMPAVVERRPARQDRAGADAAPARRVTPAPARSTRR
jgi:hypothetical protein